jgi:6-phosphogluconolactonase
MALCACALMAAPPVPVDWIMYVGSYTGKGSDGITAFRFNANTGEFTSLGTAAATPNPTFLAVHPSGKYLYAANEIGNFEGGKTGSVSAFEVDAKSGKLTLLNAVSSKGNGPCHVAVDATGSVVLVANYGGGNIASLPLEKDGKLKDAASFFQFTGTGPNSQRQREPHAHSMNISPDNRFAFAADLGTDRVMVYKLDAAKGTLTPNDPPAAILKPGAGPRHFRFSPSGKVAYVINELQSTITVFQYDAAKGVLTEVQNISTLPADFTGKSTTAEVVVDRTGRFVYGSNRGHDSIAVFSADPATGKLTYVENVSTQGKTPRNFALDPTGRWMMVANQDTDNVVLYKVDANTGRLTAAGKTLSVSKPVCVRFIAAK